MRSMKGLVSSVVGILVGLMAIPAGAAIIMRVSQVAPTGAIQIPGSATFVVTMESDVANQTITGVDFTLLLSDSSGKGGVMTGGSNTLFTSGGFFASDFNPPGSGVSVDFASFSFSGTTVGATPRQVATFTLGATAAEVVEGSYSISLTALEVADGGFQTLPVTSVPVQYTLTAVPEPSAFALAGVACCGVALTQRLGRRRQPSGSGVDA